MELRRHLGELLLDPALHGYTPILGLPSLREDYAAHLSSFYGATIAPGEVGITSGCNQAFCLALMSIAKAGDQVIVPRPHYFNHDMWLRMQGVEPVPLDFRPGSGAVPTAEDAARLIGPKTRAIVLISPNNPTGAVYPRATIHAFFELARKHKLALLLDETYKDFLAQGERPHELFSDPAWRGTLVHLYSFSKVFSLTGYRVGAAICGEGLATEIAKAMDCVSICAPRLGQEAALYGLASLADWREEKRLLMRERLSALRQAMRRNDTGYELVSAGAYFAYLRHPFRGTSARDVARRLAEDENMLCLPGSMFGDGQEAYLRFAFANVAAETMPEIARRLARSARHRQA